MNNKQTTAVTKEEGLLTNSYQQSMENESNGSKPNTLKEQTETKILDEE